MASPINSAFATTLFGRSAPNSTSGVGADLLAAAAAVKAGVGLDPALVGRDPNAPIVPVWQPGFTPGAAALSARAFAGRAFFDTGAKLFSDLGATGDYSRLFALHTGLSTLSALAGQAGDAKLTAAQKKQVQTQFTRGLSELDAFFAQQQFEDVRLAQGDRVDAARTTLALPVKEEDYTTGLIHRGGLGETLPGLNANAQFDIVATSAAGIVRRVTINLADLGSVPRSLSNVISFVNTKLAAAGAASVLVAADQTPTTTDVVIGGKVVSTKYIGPKQYALKVDVRANERIAFEPAVANPAFYAVGQVNGGARLVKLTDTTGTVGLPVWLSRPGATADPIGANVATGFTGPGAPYRTLPAGAYQQKTGVLVSAGVNNFETNLRANGEAVLKLDLADGRVLSVSTAWRGEGLEAWRTRAGESSDRAILDDLAERLTQLLHEQGVAAGVEIWESGTDAGLTIVSGDFVTASSLEIGGRPVIFQNVDPAGMLGGLRNGVFARRFEAANVAPTGGLFIDSQSFTITTTNTTQVITLNGGATGIDAATLLAQLNDQLRIKGISAAASLVDNAGQLALRIDGLHNVTGASASINAVTRTLTLQAPGAWTLGGLPVAAAGQPFGDAVRTSTISGASPLLTHTGALDIAIVVSTPTGDKTVTVAVSAAERIANPDPVAGQWHALFQTRLDAALNAAGVYVGAQANTLTTWRAGEGAGHRIASIGVNGAAQTLVAATPALGIGGAFSVERSFTSAQAATTVTADVAALVASPNVSISFDTIWGARTVNAALAVGDPRSLQSAALRLNEALAAAGYDLGVAAVDLSGGGSGLRAVAGAAHALRGVSNLSLGATAHAITLDPIDSLSRVDDPAGTLRVSVRAARGAASTQTIVSSAATLAPSANAAGWFPGRAFDVAVGGTAKVATARAAAAAADGSVYVLADLDGDSANLPIKGARDVALFKYDSAGKLVSTRILGASDKANGFTLAVSADGKVAVAGSVEGALANAGAARGGTDSFVTLFDANGGEVWSVRNGARANDEVRALTFAPNGAVIVTGKTESALGTGVALGGADAYVRGYSASGLELFTRQFGTGSADTANALLVRDAGAGVTEIFTGGVENNRGIVRRFTYSAGAGLTVGVTRDIGNFLTGGVNALAYDAGALYVGGEVGADRLSLGAPARGAVAAQEGFVARLDPGLVSTALDRASYLGSAQNDAVTAIAVVGGTVYAAGVAGGVLAGQSSANAKAGFLARLDASGVVAWTKSFNSALGTLSLQGLVVSQTGASALDALGLPRGALAAGDSGSLTSRSALAVGDEFKLGADGRRIATIAIGAADTLQSLTAAINRVLGGAGRAEIVRENGFERVRIAAGAGRAVRLESGRAGKDALPALGLSPGIIAKNTGQAGVVKTFGLGLNGDDLKLDSKAAIAQTKAELSAAASIVRQAYEAILRPNAKELTAAEKALEARRQAAGAAPPLFNKQLANYRAALARLGGGA